MGSVVRTLRSVVRTLRFGVAAWLSAPLVELSLKRFGVRRTLRWVEAISSRRRPPRGEPISVHSGARAVNRAYRLHFLRGQCLPRSLVQYGLHRVEGLQVRFVIGVSPPGDGELAAHAWVERLGEDGAPDGFVPLRRAAEEDAWSPTDTA